MLQITLNNKELEIKYAHNPFKIITVYACEQVLFDGGRITSAVDVTGSLSKEELQEIESECLAAHEDYAKKEKEWKRVLALA
jgi:hypothetical protein